MFYQNQHYLTTTENGKHVLKWYLVEEFLKFNKFELWLMIKHRKFENLVLQSKVQHEFKQIFWDFFSKLWSTTNTQSFMCMIMNK